MVKEHVSTCADCREELQFMKKFRKEISSLKPVRAPADFLDRLHERMGQGERNGVIQKLFFPLKIKIPLEALGLAAAAAVIVLIFNPFREEPREFMALESPASRARIERDSQQAPGEMRETRKAATRAAGRRSAGKAVDDNIIAYDRGPADFEGSPPQAKNDLAEKSLEKKKSTPDRTGMVTLYLARNEQETPASTAGEIQPVDDQDRAKKEIASEEKTLSSKKGMKYNSAKQTVSAGSVPANGAIERAALSLDGRIIIKTCEEASKPCRHFVIDLPAENYGRFLRLIGRSWSVRKQLPDKPPAGAERVRVNINLE